jgi:hypothetical protein
VHATAATARPGAGAQFTGYLRNDGRTVLRDPSVRMTFFGRDGRPKEVAYVGTFAHRVAPGRTAAYTFISARAGSHDFFRAAPSAVYPSLPPHV